MLILNSVFVLMYLTSVVTSLNVVNESLKAKETPHTASGDTSSATPSSSAGSAGGNEHNNEMGDGISNQYTVIGDPGTFNAPTIGTEGGSFTTGKKEVTSSEKKTKDKGTAKSLIVARKGAEQNDASSTEGFSATSTSTKLPDTSQLTTPAIDKSHHSESKLNSNRTDSTQLKMSGENVSVPRVSPKPKPTFTNGEGNDDEEMPSTSAQKPQIGVMRKIDYIVPIAITIMAVPLLGVGAFVLYRQGRDCWDKRHYRRMDFLIDGMYND